MSLGEALGSIITDPSADRTIRGSAARALAIADGRAVVEILLKQLFSQEGRDEMWETALALVGLGNSVPVGPLILALNDVNPFRRHVAAYTLCRIPGRGHAVTALSNALTDVSQPVDVRDAAAESLAHLDSRRAIAPLLSVLSDPDVRIRFWAVFALGTIRRDRRVIPALEAMLSDHAVMQGNWWSVAREALAMLGQMDPPEPRYRDQLVQEIQRVMDDPNASPEDRRWAES